MAYRRFNPVIAPLRRSSCYPDVNNATLTPIRPIRHKLIYPAVHEKTGTLERVVMQKTNQQPIYSPEEWDIDFSFDLELNFFEYLILGCYLIFVVPVTLLLKAVEFIYEWFTGLFNNKQDQGEIQRADYSLLSMISKIF